MVLPTGRMQMPSSTIGRIATRQLGRPSHRDGEKDMMVPQNADANLASAFWGTISFSRPTISSSGWT
jgi:hypothetical protein